MIFERGELRSVVALPHVCLHPNSADRPSLMRPHWLNSLGSVVTLVTGRCCRVGRDDAMRVDGWGWWRGGAPGARCRPNSRKPSGKPEGVSGAGDDVRPPHRWPGPVEGATYRGDGATAPVADIQCEKIR